jgi:chorismate synthase
MSGNSFGTIFKVTTFGESHGKAMGCIIDGCPAGLPLCAEDIEKELRRRRPGAEEPFSSARAEEDSAEILSGVYKEKTLGTPIAVIIKNNDQKPDEYDKLKDLYRPGHADWSWEAKYGFKDARGGGRSSGRETVSRVAAGAVAKVFLASHGITFSSWTNSSGDEQTAARLEKLKAMGDSAGCIVACRISGIPAGIGEPVFGKLDALLSHAVLSIGACKGIEFGTGFAAASSTGSANNDVPALPPCYAANAVNSAANKEPTFKSNNSGGMLGGISNGMDVFFRAAFKPPSSIAAEQGTIDRNGNPVSLSIKGRHDICLAPRVLPVVEAMAALVIADLLLLQRCARM